MEFIFGQSYYAYMRLFAVKLWNKVFDNPLDEPDRLGEPYESLSEKLSLFWSDAPTQIDDRLYLGSAKNAADREVLRELNIQVIINCTNDIPNFFEHEEKWSRVYSHSTLRCRTRIASPST